MKNLFKYKYIGILIVLLLAYAYNDITTSRQAGFRDAIRSSVYVYLLSIIAWIGAYVVFCKKNTTIRRSLAPILITLTSWIVFINLVNGAPIWTFGIHVALSMWWIIAYYFFAYYPRNNPDSINTIILLFVVMFLFYVWANIFLRANIRATFDRENAVSGFIYLLVMMTPFLLLVKKKIIRTALIAISVFMIATSLKRGAMVSTVAMWLVYLYTDAVIKRKPFSFFGKLTVFSVLGLVVISYANELSRGFLAERFSSDQLESGSGRFDMWDHVLVSLEYRDFISLLLGTGSGSSIKLLGTGVHNEWLEFLFSFGIVGLLLYLWLYLKIISKYIFLIKINSAYAPLYGMITIYLLTASMYSGMYFQHSAFYIFSFLGLGEYLVQSEHIKQKTNDNIKAKISRSQTTTYIA